VKALEKKAESRPLKTGNHSAGTQSSDRAADPP